MDEKKQETSAGLHEHMRRVVDEIMEKMGAAEFDVHDVEFNPDPDEDMPGGAIGYILKFSISGDIDTMREVLGGEEVSVQRWVNATITVRERNFYRGRAR